MKTKRVGFYMNADPLPEGTPEPSWKNKKAPFVEQRGYEDSDSSARQKQKNDSRTRIKQERRALGLCIDCGEQADGRYRCVKHAKEHNEKQKAMRLARMGGTYQRGPYKKVSSTEA